MVPIAIIIVIFITVCVDGFQNHMLTFRRSHFLGVKAKGFPIRNPSSSTKLYMFDRIIRLISSNVNSFLKGMEDPEKIIEQAVLDMQNDLVRIRQSYADVYATQKRMEKQKEAATSTANEWYRRAQLAISKGEEGLAREALLQKQQQLDVVNNINKQLEIQSGAVEKLYSSMQVLEKKIAEAKRQKESFIARAKTAKTSLEVNNLLQSITGKISSSNSMEAFERMKEKVESLETQAEMAGEMVPGSSPATQSLEEKFQALEGNREVEEELQRLKSGANVVIPLLPVSVEDELEQMKSDIFYNRRKVR